MNRNSETTIETASITAVDGPWFEILLAGRPVRAKLAFSCPVRPQPDDHVLLSSDPSGICYILAILKREGDCQSMELEFPADVTLRAPNGQLGITAVSDLRLSSASRIQTLSPELAMQAENTTLASRQLDVCGEQAGARFQRGRFYVHHLESVADTALHCARTVVRKVEGIETFNVGSLIKTVRETLTIRSNHAVISSRHDMKIDAERIHMG
jgi:hypothetical protein